MATRLPKPCRTTACGKAPKPQAEEKVEDSVVEELPNAEYRKSPDMESPDELDSDLFDRMSYLNLMSQYEEKQRRRKEAEALRRLRDDAEALSPRGEESPRAGPVVGSAAAMLPALPVDVNIKMIWAEALEMSELTSYQQSDILSLRIALGIDRVSTETLVRFHVKGHVDSYDQPAILYPRYRGPASRLRPPAGLKVIRKVGDKLDKESFPEGEENTKARFSGIFGYHMATASDRRVIVTTNERDALAVYESTGGMLSFALPLGEKMDTSALTFLDEFEQIYLWFPAVHVNFARDYAAVLNSARCYIINVRERPIELLRGDRRREVNKIIREEAIRVRNKGFRSMIDIRPDLKSELINSRSRQMGITQRFDVLNKYLLGFRPAELTVLTGGTGVGKTTFLCEYSLDLFSQGVRLLRKKMEIQVRTLFCSFEMPDEKILKWMLVQYAALPLYRVEHHPSVDVWLDRFERAQGDLIIMKVDEFRDKSITQIANAIKNQVVNNGVQHVVVDNLQFLVGLATLHNDKASALERYNQQALIFRGFKSVQDRFVGLMRSMATDYGPHVTMVVHPRKSEVTGDAEIDIQHFGGSARVTQEADTVLVIQRKRSETERHKYRKFLHILKNRYGGRKVETDTIEMLFQPATYSHTLIDHAK